MTNSAPVAYDDSSLARNSTKVATSSETPGRPSGTVTMSSGKCLVIGVRMKPGWMELTRMFCEASSSAADLVRPRTAHLEATYGCTMTAPRRPSIEETLMMEQSLTAVDTAASRSSGWVTSRWT